MKKSILSVFLSAFAGYAFAQDDTDKKMHFSVGPEFGFAASDFSKTHSVGIGATAQLDGRISQYTHITLTTGYISYAGKSAGAGVKFKAAGIIPLKGGIKYFFTDAFYAASQIGVGFFSNNLGSAFAYTPMLGYEFAIKSEKAMDVSLKYDGYSKNGSSLGSIGLRLAFRF